MFVSVGLILMGIAALLYTIGVYFVSFFYRRKFNSMKSREPIWQIGYRYTEIINQGLEDGTMPKWVPQIVKYSVISFFFGLLWSIVALILQNITIFCGNVATGYTLIHSYQIDDYQIIFLMLSLVFDFFAGRTLNPIDDNSFISNLFWFLSIIFFLVFAIPLFFVYTWWKVLIAIYLIICVSGGVVSIGKSTTPY